MTDNWRPYNDLKPDSDFLAACAGLEAIEFLAGQDAPSGIFRKGDVVRAQPALMNCALFSHWRPVPGDDSQTPTRPMATATEEIG